MAKQQIVIVHDDLDGSEGASTVKFGLDGKSYEIDLSEAHEKELRALLEKYVGAASIVRNMPITTSARREYGTGPKRQDTRHIREWLGGQGYTVSDRGRIPTDYMRLWNQYGVHGHDVPKEKGTHVNPQRTAPLQAISAPVGNPGPIDIPETVPEAPQKPATAAKKSTPAPKLPPVTDKVTTAAAKKTAAKPRAKKPTETNAA